MKKVKPETHQACRSLIQKAVRRGDLDLTEKVALHLHNIGDTTWLKNRSAVILFEECWTLAAHQSLATDIESTLATLKKVTQAKKAKDAAGLGSLAYEYSKGDYSVLSKDANDQYIKHLNEAIKRPNDFWEWVCKQCIQPEQLTLVETARRAYSRASWPWDKTFILAAAYLAIKADQLTAPFSEQSREVPLWVALDKHTPQGKLVISEAAKVVGIAERQLSWISFYLESALLNDANKSYWWSREIQWRLKKIGMDYEKANAIWNQARPVVIELLKEQTEQLAEHLSRATVEEPSHHPSGNSYIQKSFLDISSEEISDEDSLITQGSLPGF